MSLKKTKKIRYGVVGLGHIAQTAVLPAFAHASKNSKLEVLISEDSKKLKLLSKKYNVSKCYSFDELETCLLNNEIDVLYIATPNDTHKDIVKMAATHNVHVLCEKPMAVTSGDCQIMNQAAIAHKIKLMIAYRLHFEAANLEVIKLCRSGKLGDLKFFNSTFSFQIKEDNIRTNSEKIGGGAVYDIGAYCINAARYIFQAEPIEVFAMSSTSNDKRFRRIDETTSVILKFPDNAQATFTVSFGATETSSYEIVGSKGKIRLENSYDYANPMTLKFKKDGQPKETVKTFKKRDQFAAELLYFSQCILTNKNPEPSGLEGLADIRVVEGILNSIKIGIPISLGPVSKSIRPNEHQEISKPGLKKHKAVHATGPKH